MAERVVLLLLLSASLALANWESLPHQEKHLRQLDQEQKARELAYHKELQRRHELRHIAIDRQHRHSSVSATNPTDKEALISLYSATHGANWNNNTGWKDQQSDPCGDRWFGIYCEEEYVTYISLPFNGLYGKLPADMGRFSKLNSLYLYSNGLTGEIPAGLWGIKTLQYFDLNSNQLTGSIPSEVDLPSLVYLALYANKLSDNLPTTWNVPNLTNLSLAQNAFTGPLPSEIGQITNLEELIMSGNNLTGEYPASFGKLGKLARLWLFNNFLKGPFPSSWESLVSLEQVELQQMTGKIPEYIGTEWQNLQLLVIPRGQLEGEIPESLCSLKEIGVLWLFQNNLTGSIPDCITTMSSLTDLQLSTNQLTGKIPQDIGRLTNLQRLYINQNYLSGSIPSSVGDLKNAESIGLCQNYLTGEVPSSLAALKGSLYEVGFCYNKLSTFGSGLEDFMKFIGDYGCELYNNPWECPIPSYVPKDCNCICSQCNSGNKHTSCSSCSADSGCGWCTEGPNCLEGGQTGPQGYHCNNSDWIFGNSCP